MARALDIHVFEHKVAGDGNYVEKFVTEKTPGHEEVAYPKSEGTYIAERFEIHAADCKHGKDNRNQKTSRDRCDLTAIQVVGANEAPDQKSDASEGD